MALALFWTPRLFWTSKLTIPKTSCTCCPIPRSKACDALLERRRLEPEVVREWAKTFHRGSGRFLIFAGGNCHVAGGGHIADVGDGQSWVAKSCKSCEGQLAGFLEHVKRDNQEGNYGEPDGEDGESGEQLAHEIELRQDQDDEECPQPDAAIVVRACLRGEVRLHDCLLIF